MGPPFDAAQQIRTMQRAGHTNFATTQIYIREAETLGVTVGIPWASGGRPLSPRPGRTIVSPIVHGSGRPRRFHHSPPKVRLFRGESGAIPSVPKGNRTVVNFEDFPSILLAVVA